MTFRMEMLELTSSVEYLKAESEVQSKVELVKVIPKIKQRGRPVDEVISRLAIRYKEKFSDKPWWGCIGASQYVPTQGPCTHKRWGNADRACILNHAKTCKHLPTELKRYAHDIAAEGALGEKVGQAAVNGKDAHTLSEHLRPSVAASQPLSSIGKLSTEVMVPGKLSQKALVWNFTKRTKEQTQNEINFRILKLVCCRGVPPHVIGSSEFRDLITFCCNDGPNQSYAPVSPDHLSKKLIADEASSIRRRILDLLKGQRNLTLSFDGHTTRKPESVYTVHITTEERVSYFWAGYEDSGRSHDYNYVKEKISEVCCELKLH